jgi:hypothetical protein
MKLFLILFVGVLFAGAIILGIIRGIMGRKAPDWLQRIGNDKS